jgi:hypothetical protein
VPMIEYTDLPMPNVRSLPSRCANDFPGFLARLVWRPLDRKSGEWCLVAFPLFDVWIHNNDDDAEPGL